MLAYMVELGKGELDFSIEELRVEQRYEVLKVAPRSRLQVDILGVGFMGQRLEKFSET